MGCVGYLRHVFAKKAHGCVWWGQVNIQHCNMNFNFEKWIVKKDEPPTDKKESSTDKKESEAKSSSGATGQTNTAAAAPPQQQSPSINNSTSNNFNVDGTAQGSIGAAPAVNISHVQSDLLQSPNPNTTVTMNPQMAPPPSSPSNTTTKTSSPSPTATRPRDDNSVSPQRNFNLLSQKTVNGALINAVAFKMGWVLCR